jgi:hypothetical protein
MKAAISIHDRYQVELKVSYSLPRDCRTSAYEFDLYMFAPQSLGISAETYSKKQFYTDLQARIRLKTPLVPLNHLVGGKASPLEQLRASIAAVAQEPGKEPPADYEKQIKLFCCLARSAIRDSVVYVQGIPHPEDRERLVGQYVESVQKLAAAYRELRSIIQTPGMGARALDLYFFGDEYISLLIEDYTSHLSDMASTPEAALSPKGKELLLGVIRGEVHYRCSRKYPSIPDKETDNETLLFRKSVLKKFVASILFLDTEAKKAGRLLEQTLFGLAAAAAMIFATAVAFISQSLYGALTLPVFIALVVSYVFKDRLKDILRYYWSRRITCYLFDHTTRIHDATRNIVGKCKESFEFMADSKVPQDILQLRDRQHITEIENGWMGEEILLYRKRVRLYPKRIRHIFTSYSIEGLNDIIRFNVQEFLRKMDDPKKDLFVMDDQGLLPVKGTRVYHLNLVLRLDHDGACSCSRHRLVLNRKGIKRIEQAIGP